MGRTLKEEAPVSKLPTCSDGYDRNSGLVIAKGKYGALKWLGLLTGVSVKPDKVIYQCTVCNESFDESVDEEVLKHDY